MSPNATTRDERFPGARSRRDFRRRTLGSVFAGDLGDEMAEELWQDGEATAEETAGYLGDAGEFLNQTFRLGRRYDTHVQRYSSFSRYVKSSLCMTSTLVMRRMVLEKHALPVVSVHTIKS